MYRVHHSGCHNRFNFTYPRLYKLRSRCILVPAFVTLLINHFSLNILAYSTVILLALSAE